MGFVTEKQGAYCEVQTNLSISGSHSHHGGPHLTPSLSIWDLWWTRWHKDRVFSEYFEFPQSFYQCFYTHIYLKILIPERNGQRQGTFTKKVVISKSESTREKDAFSGFHR
jgi:hypothetical protein